MSTYYVDQYYYSDNYNYTVTYLLSVGFDAQTAIVGGYIYVLFAAISLLLYMRLLFVSVIEIL